MEENRFDVKKLDKLNNPMRLELLPPKFLFDCIKFTPSVVIDVGAGTGFYSKEFASKFKQTVVYGCDVSEVMVDYIGEKVTTKYPNIIPMKMEDSEVSLSDGIADLVVMIYLHHELDYHDKTLRECMRLLKSGGKILISDWKKRETKMGPPIDIRFEESEVEEQLITAGFSNIELFSELDNNFVIVATK